MKKFKANGKELMLVELNSECVYNIDLPVNKDTAIFKGVLSELNDELEEYVIKRCLYKDYMYKYYDRYNLMCAKSSFLSLLKSQGIELEHENYLLIELI